MGLKKAAFKQPLSGATTSWSQWWTATWGVAIADPVVTYRPTAVLRPGADLAALLDGQPAAATKNDDQHHDGTFTVGDRHRAGTGPASGGSRRRRPACYWSAMSSADNNKSSTTRMTEEVADRRRSRRPDASFKTNGCQPWTLTDEAPAAGRVPTGLLGQLQLGSDLRPI